MTKTFNLNLKFFSSALKENSNISGSRKVKLICLTVKKYRQAKENVLICLFSYLNFTSVINKEHYKAINGIKSEIQMPIHSYIKKYYLVFLLLWPWILPNKT